MSDRPARLGSSTAFAVIALIACMNIFVDGILPYVAGSMALAIADVQSIERLFGLAVLVAVIPAGLAADRFGPRRVILAGAALLGSGAAVCAVASGPIFLAAGRATQGLGAALCLPACYAAMRPRRIGLFIGSCQTVFGLIGVVTAITQGAVVDAASWHVVFLLMLGLDVLAFGLAFRFRATTDRDANRKLLDVFGDEHPTDAAGPVRRSVWPALALAVPLLLLLLAVFPAAMTAVTRVSLAFGLARQGYITLGVLLCGPLLGILADRLDARWIAFVASLALAASLGLFIWKPSLDPNGVLDVAAWVVGNAGIIAFARLVLTAADGRLGFAMGVCLAAFTARKALMLLFPIYASRAAPFPDIGTLTLGPGFALALAATACAALAVGRRRTG